jgi:hypothetical protein
MLKRIPSHLASMTTGGDDFVEAFDFVRATV